MAETEEQRARRAAAAAKEEIQGFIHDPSPRVLKSLLESKHLGEEDVLAIADRKNISPEILEAIARDKRWSESYPVRLALARNPRSPLTVSLSLARFLRIFDLEEITRNHFIPLVFRHKVEAMIVERVPTMPLGNKKALAQKAAGAVLLKLLQDRIPEVVKLCLNNPHMIESHLYKVISRSDTAPKTIIMIAEHPVWSQRTLIRYSLARNVHTPLSLSVRFIGNMKLSDLRELLSDPLLPVTIRPFVHRELIGRGVDPEDTGRELVYEIDEEEMTSLENAYIEEMSEQSEQEEPENGDDKQEL